MKTPSEAVVQTAGSADSFARQPHGIVRGQKNDDWRDFLRPAESRAERRSPLLPHFLRGHCRTLCQMLALFTSTFTEPKTSFVFSNMRLTSAALETSA